ncbi:MAG: hypothetical protein O3C69_03865 [Chloroflexi bacterium]|nr:hypothetical protein [Chloroflexota bacterium]
MRYVAIGRSDASKSRLVRRLTLTLLPVSLIAAAIACGSGSGSAPASSVGGAGDDLALVSTTLFPERSFTFDDLVAAGWKKSKQFPTGTVPGSTDIWYGFFDQKDIEVRFYNSHQDASTLGVESAAAAIDQAFREGGQVGASNRGAGSSAVTKYKAFAVVGDTVILCELNVSTCVALANALAAS